MYGIVDCDNCYVSCERVFRPDLNGKPVVVLSNNEKIAVFSSNYELYGELTGRIVEIIKQEAPAYFRYSIDECFVYFDRLENTDNKELKEWGENLHQRIKKSVGMPVSIGLGPTKTLAKLASHFAKKYPGYR